MQHRRFGRTGLQVPVIGMGTWKTFDVKGDAIEKDRYGVLDAALETGANFVDSSPMYGEAERVLGDAIGERRKDVYVATKVWTAQGKYRADDQIQFALQCFGGSIDLYQIHNLSETDMVLDKLEKLKADGIVGHIGITHYQESQFSQIMKWMETGRIDTIQIPYNVDRTTASEEIIPLATELDLGVIVMVPLGSGELVRLPVPQDELLRFEQFGCTTWAQVLLKWIVSDERVHVLIPATSKAERMTENAKAGEGLLFDDAHRKIVQDLAKKYR